MYAMVGLIARLLYKKHHCTELAGEEAKQAETKSEPKKEWGKTETI